MRKMLNAVVLALVLSSVAGLVVVAVSRARETAARTQCLNNLKGIALLEDGLPGPEGQGPRGPRPPAPAVLGRPLPPDRS
jgi:hypothetical protein